MKSKVTSKQARQICELLESNELSTRKIADQVGVNVASVYRILHGKSYTDISSNYKIENYTPKTKTYSGAHYTDDQIREVCKLIEENVLTISDIFSKTGVSVETIRLIAKKKIHKDIASCYNFTSFNKRYSRKYERKMNPVVKSILDEGTVRSICVMLEEGKLPVSEIARRTQTSYSSVYNIKHYGAHRDISKDYHINNYKYRTDKYHPSIRRRLDESEVRYICRLIIEGFSILDIHKKTNIPTSILYRIRARTAYTKISSEYDF